jgi:hypothetical protein
LALDSHEPRATPASEKATAPYEFSDAHKDSFRALATSVSFIGACTLLLSALALLFALGALYLGFVPYGIGTAIAAGVDGAMAWWMVSAGRALSAMVRTRGRDVEHLMDAVAQFRRFFGLWIVAIIALALLSTGAVAIFFWCEIVLEKGGRCFGGLGWG